MCAQDNLNQAEAKPASERGPESKAEELASKGQSEGAVKAGPPEEEAVRFKVEMDNAGQTHITCLEGNQTAKVVALNPQGLSALIDLGYMRKPGAWKVGALHNWVELDGELIRLEKGKEGTQQLEKVLNERYLPSAEPGESQDVAVFPNPASPTGFDLQFPVTLNGLAGNRRYHLNEETVGLLQDTQKCRVLRKGTIAKLSPPNLVFKRRTPDGGDRYLMPAPRNTVSVQEEGGKVKTIDLSQPLDLLHLGARELAAVLNHPAINRRAMLAQVALAAREDEE